MQRVVVSVRRRGAAAETDLEVPTDVPAAELAERLAAMLGAPAGGGALELRAVSLGRALHPDETLADAGLWDGAILVLARATDPLETDARGGGALAVANASGTSLAVLPARTPPVLALPAPEAAPRSPMPWLVLGVVLLALLGAGAVWFVRGRDASSTAAPSAAPVLNQPAAEPPTPAGAPTSQSSAASSAAGQAAPDEETAWRDLLAHLDLVWGVDWPASISLLQTFHNQYPTRTAATDKLYAALVEYGRALNDAGATAAATEAFDQAVRLQPQRPEARAELAALAPPPTAAPEPAPVVAVAAPPAPVASSPPAAPVVAPAPAQPAPPPAPSEPAAAACDVRSSDVACPLADGASLQDTIDVPDGHHFYWFGVPVPNMRLRVEVGGPACPCALRLYSDQVDDGHTPIASAGGADASPIVLDGLMADPGPYLMEVVSDPSGSGPSAPYTLAFSLQASPPPAPAAEDPPAAPAESSPARVSVPPVVAHSVGEASDRVRAAGLVPQPRTEDRFSPGGEGTVAAQDPPAGTQVPPGSSVTLAIASGRVVVPAVVGLPEQEAWAALHAAGLEVETRHAPRSNVEAGRAARVDPGAGSLLGAGVTVILTISQGG